MAVYTRTAIRLHWLMAILILTALPLGLFMADLALSPLKLKLYAWHKWLGVTVFALAVVRLFWRVTHAAPPLPGGIPVWQRHIAGGMHGLLYVLMLAIPLSGWLMSSAKGFQTVYLGVLPIPDLLARNEALGETLGRVHMWLNYVLMGLLMVHLLAALKHQFWDRDEVLSRIWPGLRAGRGGGNP